MKDLRDPLTALYAITVQDVGNALKEGGEMPEALKGFEDVFSIDNLAILLDYRL